MVPCIFANPPCAITLRPPRGCVIGSPTVTCHFPIVTRKPDSSSPCPMPARIWIGAGAETRESKPKTTHLPTTTCRREHTRAETCIRHYRWICTAIAVPLDPSMRNLGSWVATTEPTCRLYIGFTSYPMIGSATYPQPLDMTKPTGM